MAAARAMLSLSDDLSSLSSSPWSSTISSLSDSSAFQVSSSLEATSSLAALAEEQDEDLASEPEPGQQDPSPHEPAYGEFLGIILGLGEVRHAGWASVSIQVAIFG